MEVHTVTGGNRDYIKLVAATIAECSMLIAVASSKFIPNDAVLLIADGERVELRISVGKPRGTQQLDPATREAIDATP